MKYCLFTLNLVIQVHFALSSLPAPVNVTVDSLNFHHVLRWHPGPGTPPGAQYAIFRWVNKKKNRRKLPNRSNTTTWLELKLENETRYFFSVQASHHLSPSPSPESSTVTFTPFVDTVLGPPTLSLAGCGNCIHINISMPEAGKRAKIPDIHEYYKTPFFLFWKKAGGSQASSPLSFHDKTFTLDNLEVGTEYCVQVYMRMNHDKNSMSSNWTCTFTSILEPSRVSAVIGAVSALLIVAGCAVAALTSCLIYTRFLCQQVQLPGPLLTVLVQANILTPQRTILDPVSISTEPDKHRKIRNPRIPQPAGGGPNPEEEEDEDEDEEEKGNNVYMDRAAELSSGTSSCRDSGDASGASVPTVSGDSGSFSVKSAEVEEGDEVVAVGVVQGGQDQVEAKDKRAEVSLMPDWDQTGFLGGMEEEKDCDNLGNVNLFSVTLASLRTNEEDKEQEEEEQSTRDSLIDFFKPSEQPLLLPTDLRRTSSSTEPDDQTPLALMQSADCRETRGYEGRQADRTDRTDTFFFTSHAGETQPNETQEEEEEEEFSGYMGRR